eukprot:tig00000704_g3315.t1
MPSAGDTAGIKAEIQQSLDDATAGKYFAALKGFLTSKCTKAEFDRVIRELMVAPEKIRLHNKLVRAMLQNAHTAAGIPAPDHKHMPRDRRAGKDQFRRAEKRQKGAQGQIVDRRLKPSEYSASQRAVPQQPDQALYEEDDFDVMPVTDSAVPIDPDYEDDPSSFYQSQPREDWLQADTEDILDTCAYLPSEEDDAVKIAQKAQEEGMPQASISPEFVKLAHKAKEMFLLDILQILVGMRPSARISGGTLSSKNAGLHRLQLAEARSDELDGSEDPESLYKMYGVSANEFLYMHQHRMFSSAAGPIGKERDMQTLAPPHTVTVEDAITAASRVVRSSESVVASASFINRMQLPSAPFSREGAKLRHGALAVLARYLALPTLAEGRGAAGQCEGSVLRLLVDCLELAVILREQVTDRLFCLCFAPLLCARPASGFRYSGVRTVFAHLLCTRPPPAGSGATCGCPGALLVRALLSAPAAALLSTPAECHLSDWPPPGRRARPLLRLQRRLPSAHRLCRAVDLAARQPPIAPAPPLPGEPVDGLQPDTKRGAPPAERPGRRGPRAQRASRRRTKSRRQRAPQCHRSAPSAWPGGYPFPLHLP